MVLEIGALRGILPARLLAVVEVAAQLAHGMGREVCIVGGVVRDLFLHRPSIDLDLLVGGLEDRRPSADPYIQALAARLGGRITYFDPFLTSEIALETGDFIDVALAREESYSHPGALPTVRPGDLHADLKRRDFSLNAMALHLIRPGEMQLMDPHGGHQALLESRLTILHPLSFVDDPTRILRGLRFNHRLGFGFDDQTRALAQEAIQQRAFSTLSAERVAQDLQYLLAEDHDGLALGALMDLGLDGPLGLKGQGGAAYPAYLAFLAAQLPENQDEWDGHKHQRLPPSRAMAILYHLARGDGSAWLDALVIRGERRRRLLAERKILSTLIEDSGPEHPRPISAWVAAIKDLSDGAIAVLRQALAGHKNLNPFEIAYSKRGLKAPINGRDIIALGVPPGPRVGQMLTRLTRARWDDEITTRAQALSAVARWLEDSP